MSKIVSISFIICTLAGLAACATLDKGGENVMIVSSVDKSCKNLGPVNVSVTGWGLAAESQNVLRNNAASLGGNAVIQNGNESGIAYYCPPGSEAR